MLRKTLAITALALMGLANSHFCTATKIFVLNSSNRQFEQAQIVYFETSILHNISNDSTNNIFWAIAKDNFDEVKTLCTAIKNINKLFVNNINPLQLACRNGWLDIVKYLVEVCKADVNYQSEQANKTPLSWACSQGHKEIVKYLLDHNADPSKGNKQTKPIHEVLCSSTENHFACLQLLVKTKKINIDAPGNRDRTALQKACSQGYIKIVEYLLKNGANQNIKDEFDRTAWDFANQCFNEEARLSILTLLNLYKAPYFCKNLAQCAILATQFSGEKLLQKQKQSKPHELFYDMKIKFTKEI